MFDGVDNRRHRRVSIAAADCVARAEAKSARVKPFDQCRRNNGIFAITRGERNFIEPPKWHVGNIGSKVNHKGEGALISAESDKRGFGESSAPAKAISSHNVRAACKGSNAGASSRFSATDEGIGRYF